MTTITRANGASTATPAAGNTHQTSTQQLRLTIEEITDYANQVLAEIASVARLALLAMETPACQRNTEPLAHAFSVVAGLAADMQNTINCTAEEIGCGVTDEAMLRRAKACSASREGGAA